MANAKTKVRAGPHAARLARGSLGTLLALAIAALLSACPGLPEPESDNAGNAGGGAGAVVTCVIASGDPVLTWDPVDPTAFPGLLGYRVYYGTSPGVYVQAQGNGINVGNVTTFSVTGLSSGVTYYFATTAYDAAGESVFSNEVCKTLN